MSKRKARPKTGYGQGKHRKARVRRFNAKHPDFLSKHREIGDLKKEK